MPEAEGEVLGAGNSDAPPDPGGGAPVGPSPDEEEAFLAEQRAGAPMPDAPRAGPGGSEADPEAAAEMPPLEDLVKRIPLPARDLMEELFRAKFVTVKRVPRAALKSSG